MGCAISRFFHASGKPTDDITDESSSSLCLNLENSIDSWISETKRTLTTIAECPAEASETSNLPPWLLQELLDENDSDFQMKTVSSSLGNKTNQDFLIKGVPRRPLYKDVALRLLQWSRLCNQKESAIQRLMVSAERINFEEISDRATTSFHALTPPGSVEALGLWLQQVDTFSILRLLGMRHTIGSDGALIPSRQRLLQACRAIHTPNRSQLSVAARARSKHAHRGRTRSFFGVAKGPAGVQNNDTEIILLRLFDTAIWINRHRFVGLGEGAVAIEIRVLEGYGARWVLNTIDNAVTFRGFLEPQMKDGHANKWRHC
ncbi:MAG: hypothetical protein SGBAC_011787 [Bacillariaceae sp.]